MKIRLLAPHYVKGGTKVGSEHDVDDALAQRLIDRGVAENTAPKAQAPAKADTPDDSWTVADLRDYAHEHNIDLGDVSKKADILDAIGEAKPGE